MTRPRTTDMGESRDSLRQAIGRLDEAALAPTGRATAVRARAGWGPVPSRWAFLLVLVAVSVADETSSGSVTLGVDRA